MSPEQAIFIDALLEKEYVKHDPGIESPGEWLGFKKFGGGRNDYNQKGSTVYVHFHPLPLPFSTRLEREKPRTVQITWARWGHLPGELIFDFPQQWLQALNYVAFLERLAEHLAKTGEVLPIEEQLTGRWYKRDYT